jgi:membrane protease YdiL (CAAX protease family)
MVGSIFYFGVPTAVFSATLLWLVPWMTRRGFGSLAILNVVIGLLPALELIAALIAFRLEGRSAIWTVFRDRLRLSRPNWKNWLWTLAVLVFAFGLTALIAPIAESRLGFRLVTVPAETHAFANSLQAGLPETELSGRWDVLLWLLLVAAVNVGGEELWWRGIVLPRQEAAFGRWAWVGHGILWNLFHIARYETVAGIVVFLPATLAIPYLAQHTKNTWPGIVVHLILNSLGMVAVFQRVLG